MANQSVASQLYEILDGVLEDVKETYDKQSKKVAKETVQELKNTSPKKTGSYAKGWTVKSSNGELVVYNKTDWQLTHLLEDGHEVVNKKGRYGRTNGIKHIRPARDKAESELLIRISEGLK